MQQARRSPRPGAAAGSRVAGGLAPPLVLLDRLTPPGRLSGGVSNRDTDSLVPSYVFIDVINHLLAIGRVFVVVLIIDNGAIYRARESPSGSATARQPAPRPPVSRNTVEVRQSSIAYE
ncbi:hypothetical protein EVAR_40495_1 [Eumeta japonica]|uniref:Uncharacterized protein n=1 Tax=Eumeta variegata TaxID=151549 RepID=A0A4C1XYF5_EUMVA|nr:hypothetical protein EVAR_40495_1 [Eumeta japonica]